MRLFTKHQYQIVRLLGTWSMTAMHCESNIWRCSLAPGTADDSLSDQSLLKQIAQCECPHGLIHMPAMADNDAFTRKCVGLEGRKEKRNLGDVRHHGEFLIDGLA